MHYLNFLCIQYEYIIKLTLGLAGIVTGTVIHSIYKYPETGKKVLVVSTLSGKTSSLLLYKHYQTDVAKDH